MDSLVQNMKEKVDLTALSQEFKENFCLVPDSLPDIPYPNSKSLQSSQLGIVKKYITL